MNNMKLYAIMEKQDDDTWNIVGIQGPGGMNWPLVSSQEYLIDRGWELVHPDVKARSKKFVFTGGIDEGN